jgi:hypothetical protein
MLQILKNKKEELYDEFVNIYVIKQLVILVKTQQELKPPLKQMTSEIKIIILKET